MTMLAFFCRLTGAAVVLMIADAPVDAATTSASLAISFAITSDCKVAASVLNFGTVSAPSAAIYSTSVVSFQCTQGTPYELGLSYGASPIFTSGVWKNRLYQGSDSMKYNLFKDAAYTTYWGPDSGLNTVTGTGSGGVQNLTVYGRVQSGQPWPTPGAYSDTIQVTVSF